MGKVNTTKIKSLIVGLGLTQEKVAELMGLNYTTFNLKINNERRIYVDEVAKLCEILDIKTSATLKECFGLDFLDLSHSREKATEKIGGGA